MARPIRRLVLLTMIVVAVVPCVRGQLPAATVEPAALIERDERAPIVFVFPPDETREDLTLVIRARILDDSGVRDATVWVRGESDGGFRAFPMRELGSGLYAASVPPWPRRGSRVAYYVEASDVLGNGPGWAGNSATPLIARFEPVETADYTVEVALVVGMGLLVALIVWILQFQVGRRRGALSDLPPISKMR